jgi:hypothetical protein
MSVPITTITASEFQETCNIKIYDVSNPDNYDTATITGRQVLPEDKEVLCTEGSQYISNSTIYECKSGKWVGKECPYGIVLDGSTYKCASKVDRFKVDRFTAPNLRNYASYIILLFALAGLILALMYKRK